MKSVVLTVVAIESMRVELLIRDCRLYHDIPQTGKTEFEFMMSCEAVNLNDQRRLRC
jgi:hypothetical protein